MPPNNGSKGPTTQSNGNKRPSQARVVPAIPLALSKPKQSRQQARVETDVAAGAVNAAPELAPNGVGSVLDEPQQVKVVDGAVQPHTPSERGAQDATEAVKTTRSVETPVSRGSAAMSLSNGATPEPQVPDQQQVMTTPPPAPSSTAPSASPSSARKPTSKPEMRPLRTELPPAFVPSAERHTPQSGASFTAHSSQGPMSGRRPHPSTSSIVFGGHDSSETSSPAPPQSASSSFPPPQFPTFETSQPPSFMPSGHSHHVSEPFSQRLYQPGYGPPPMAWNGRAAHAQYSPQHPFFTPHSHTSFRYPPREVFTPAESIQPNGHYSRSRSASQTSSAVKAGEDLQSPTAAAGDGLAKARYPDAKPFMPTPLQLSHYRPAQMHPPPPPMPPPDATSAFENAEALRMHIWSSFGNPALADCHLQITEDSSDARQYLDAHKVILSRSPTLFDVIQQSDPPASASLRTQVHVRLRGKYVRIKPLMESLRYLYGGHLHSLDHLRHHDGNTDMVPNNEERMDIALQHIATGAWLKVPPIAAKSVEVAISLLHWDTMPSLLAFALDGGLGPFWIVDDGSEDKISCSSSDDSLGRLDTTGAPVHDPYSTQLLHRVIDFVANMLPSSFYLDASAPQLASCPRLPNLPLGHESRPSRSDPRLSQIRFGEIPVEDHQRPSPMTTQLSSVLLCLPFVLLKCILEHDILAARLGPDTVGSIMRQVVAEREVRRKKVLAARPAGQIDDGVDPQLMQTLYWEEVVEPSNQHRAGFRLARRRRGIDTPPSSGAASDRSK